MKEEMKRGGGKKGRKGKKEEKKWREKERDEET